MYGHISQNDQAPPKLIWMGWLVPFAMVSPIVRVDSYGLGAIEILVWVGGILAILRGTRLLTPRSPIVPYLWLFGMGWCLAALNGLRFGIDLQVGDFIILYRLGFSFVAWSIGYYALESIDRVATSRITLLLVVVATAIAILYGFLPYAERLTLLSYFAPSSPDMELRAWSNRFPGLGSNPNIYAFFPLCLFIFSFDCFMKKRGSALVPLLCSVLIVALSSRKTFLFLPLALAGIYLFPSGSSNKVGSPVKSKDKKPRNRLWAGIVIIVLGSFVAGLISQNVIGERVLDKLEAEALLEDSEYRYNKWNIGMQRVIMAPLLGIPEVSFSERDRLGYYITMNAPHNEFIQIWMWYGLLGLLAHVFLLLFLLWRNIQYRLGVSWYLFYIAVIVQMFVDTAFKNYQFAAVFFMIAGYNWRLLSERAAPVENHSGVKPSSISLHRKRSLA